MSLNCGRKLEGHLRSHTNTQKGTDFTNVMVHFIIHILSGTSLHSKITGLNPVIAMLDGELSPPKLKFKLSVRPVKLQLTCLHVFMVVNYTGTLLTTCILHLS